VNFNPVYTLSQKKLQKVEIFESSQTLPKLSPQNNKKYILGSIWLADLNFSWPGHCSP